MGMYAMQYNDACPLSRELMKAKMGKEERDLGNKRGGINNMQTNSSPLSLANPFHAVINCWGYNLKKRGGPPGYLGMQGKLFPRNHQLAIPF